MKILLCNAIYPTERHPKSLGGAEKSVSKIAASLAVKGHEVHVAVPIGPNDQPLSELQDGVSIHRLPTANSYDFFLDKSQRLVTRLTWHIKDDIGLAPKGFASLLDCLKPDLIHTNTLSGLSTGIWKIARSRGIPVVHTLRDYYLLCPRCTMFRKGRPCDAPCRGCRISTVGRRARTADVDGVVGNSSFILQKHTAAGLFARAQVAKVIGSIRECPESNQTPTLGWQRHDGTVTYGFIGRLASSKGIEEIISAVLSLPVKARIIIGGALDTPFARGLASKHDNDDRVEFLGFVAPSSFYRNCDVVVAPSLWHDPLPRAVIDALAFRKPVVGSNRGGIPEALGDPRNGWTYDPDDPEELHNALMAAFSFIQTGEEFEPVLSADIDIVDEYLAVYSVVVRKD